MGSISNHLLVLIVVPVKLSVSWFPSILGVIAFDATDAEDVPIALVAVTVKVYSTPLVKPVTTIGDSDPVAVIFPGEDVTVYRVIDEPPLSAGGVKATDACVFPVVCCTYGRSIRCCRRS